MHIINVREYRKGNLIWTIQRNWQHSVHKMKIYIHNNNNTAKLEVPLQNVF